MKPCPALVLSCSSFDVAHPKSNCRGKKGDYIAIYKQYNQKKRFGSIFVNSAIEVDFVQVLQTSWPRQPENKEELGHRLQIRQERPRFGGNLHCGLFWLLRLAKYLAALWCFLMGIHCFCWIRMDALNNEVGDYLGSPQNTSLRISSVKGVLHLPTPKSSY